MLKRLLKKNVIVLTLNRLRSTLPRKFRGKAMFSLVLLLVNSILELAGIGALIPLFLTFLQEDALSKGVMGEIYAWTGFQDERHFVVLLCSLILFLTIGKNIFSIFIQKYLSTFCYSVFVYITTRLQRTYYQRGFLFIKSKNSNDLVRDIANSTLSFAQNVMITTLNFLTEIFVLVFIVIGFLIYDWRILGLLAVTVLPAFYIFYSRVKVKITSAAEDVNTLQGVVYKDLFQSIFGYVDVTINNNESWFFSEYDKNITRMASKRVKLHVYNLMPSKVIESTIILAILVIICYGLFILKDKEALLILLGVFALAAYRVMPLINRLMIALLSMKAYQYTFDIVGQIKELKDEVHEQSDLKFTSSLELKQLAYSYPEADEAILENLNLKIEKGSSLGIIGKSGSGKTTLLNLLLGLLDPSDGQIEVDGVPLTKENRNAWRHLIGYVQQEVFIVDGSLAENIALGFDTIDEDRVREVISKASLDGVVANFAEGIHTEIGERGSQISGGQRQRVGIARALYAGAELLFFDEATSALDNETEMEITEAIQKLNTDDLTMVIIAHRHSTLKYCDRVIELQNGKVIDNVKLQH